MLYRYNWHAGLDQSVDTCLAINFEAYMVNFWLNYSPFSDIGILYRNNFVNKISEERFKLACLYFPVTYQGED